MGTPKRKSSSCPGRPPGMEPGYFSSTPGSSTNPAQATFLQDRVLPSIKWVDVDRWIHGGLQWPDLVGKQKNRWTGGGPTFQEGRFLYTDCPVGGSTHWGWVRSLTASSWLCALQRDHPLSALLRGVHCGYHWCCQACSAVVRHWPATTCPFDILDLQQPEREQRRLWDPPNNTSQPPRAIPPAPGGPRSRLPLAVPRPHAQRTAPCLLLPGHGPPSHHGVQHAGPGQPPAIRPAAHGESLLPAMVPAGLRQGREDPLLRCRVWALSVTCMGVRRIWGVGMEGSLCSHATCFWSSVYNILILCVLFLFLIV